MSASASDNATPVPETNTAPDPMEAALRQAAQAVDNGTEVTDAAILEAAGRKEEGQPAGGEAGKKPDASNGAERKAATDPDKKTQGKDGKKEDTKPGDKKPDDSKDSNYTKAQKEEARQRQVLTDFSKKQEALKQKEIEIQQRERALQEREQQQGGDGGSRRGAAIKDELGFTAKQYEANAAIWEEQGKFDLADDARARAAALKQQEKTGDRSGERGGGESRSRAATTLPDQTPGTPEFREKWNGHLQDLKGSEEYKDLGNKESELFRATAELLHAEPRLAQFNDGIRIAAEIAHLRIVSGSVSTLRTQLEEANQELEKLRKATTPGAGDGESRGAAEKPFEQLNATEMATHLKRAAAEVDGG